MAHLARFIKLDLEIFAFAKSRRHHVRVWSGGHRTRPYGHQSTVFLQPAVRDHHYFLPQVSNLLETDI